MKFPFFSLFFLLKQIREPFPSLPLLFLSLLYLPFLFLLFTINLLSKHSVNEVHYFPKPYSFRRFTHQPIYASLIPLFVNVKSCSHGKYFQHTLRITYVICFNHNIFLQQTCYITHIDHHHPQHCCNIVNSNQQKKYFLHFNLLVTLEKLTLFTYLPYFEINF